MRNCLFILSCFFFGCSPSLDDELQGLWKLEEVNIDGFKKYHSPTFIEINSDNCFAVSRTSGDLVGIYKFDSKRLSIYSSDQGWFNTSWELDFLPESLLFTGIHLGFRNTKLRFSKIEKIPNFQKFENRIIGRWQLYKIRGKREIKTLMNTWFEIDGNGNYSILEGEDLLESGRVSIDTRHRKMIFENDNTTWKAWFYGDELRLSNDKKGIQYSLRK